MFGGDHTLVSKLKNMTMWALGCSVGKLRYCVDNSCAIGRGTFVSELKNM